jgi:hypothetical protein
MPNAAAAIAARREKPASGAVAAGGADALATTSVRVEARPAKSERVFFGEAFEPEELTFAAVVSAEADSRRRAAAEASVRFRTRVMSSSALP